MIIGHLEQPKCPEVGSLLSKLWYIDLMKQIEPFNNYKDWKRMQRMEMEM